MNSMPSIEEVVKESLEDLEKVFGECEEVPDLGNYKERSECLDRLQEMWS